MQGEATAWIAPGLLARALDNLFGNLATAWRDKPAVAATLTLENREEATSRRAEVAFFCPWPPGITHLPAEKVFEPFASGRPSGLGLGLYQARKSLREAGGDLQAKPSTDGLSFLLWLPGRPP
jgi:C4-dicarboxylate-specific signal transduction histidine kinase